MGDRQRSILDQIQRWKDAAFDAINDIDGWRDAEDKTRAYRDPWWTIGNNFFSDTSCLVSLIISEYPTLDPAPLRDVYEWAAIWHNEHSAEQLPSQGRISARADAAVAQLIAIELAIYESKRKPRPDAGPDTKKKLVGPLPQNPKAIRVLNMMKEEKNKNRDRIDICREVADDELEAAAIDKAIYRHLNPKS